jgi:threonine dehydrogenase-like Zn-dependent dehydrogenase
MILSILLLLVILYLSNRVAPRERAEDVHVHGAGQIGLLAALALFGVDLFTSF